MNMLKSSRNLAGLLALAALTSLTAVAQSSAPRRVTETIDETQLKTLKGNVIPAAIKQNDRGPVADSFSIDRIHLVLQRSPEQEEELNQLLHGADLPACLAR